MAQGDEDKARPSLPPELVRMVRTVQQKYPDLCEQNLSAFTASAVRDRVLKLHRLGALVNLTELTPSTGLSENIEAILLPDD